MYADISGVLTAMNVALRALILGALVFLHRWPHLKWLRAYLALFIAAPILFYFIPALYTHALFVDVRNIGYLMFVGMINEVYRKEIGREARWLYPALAVILVYVFLLPSYGWYFFVPRLLLFGGMALAMQTAIREKNVPLFAYSVIAVGLLVGDLVKAVSMSLEPTVLYLQRMIDPWWGIASYMIILGGIFWPDIVRLTREMLESMPAERQDLQTVSLPSGTGTTHPREAPLESSINIFLQTSSLATQLARKEFLTLKELSVYLSVPEDYARNFVAKNNIHVYSDEEKEEHQVRRLDVERILEGEAPYSNGL
jgi:hypothetical protein